MLDVASQVIDFFVEEVVERQQSPGHSAHVVLLHALQEEWVEVLGKLACFEVSAGVGDLDGIAVELLSKGSHVLFLQRERERERKTVSI